MNKEIGIAFIIGICLLVLLIGLLKQKAGMIFRFMVRIVVGIAAMLFVNQLLESQKIEIMVGINPISVLTVGALGAGGFTLLYGIMAYRLL